MYIGTKINLTSTRLSLRPVQTFFFFFCGGYSFLSLSRVFFFSASITIKNLKECLYYTYLLPSMKRGEIPLPPGRSVSSSPCPQNSPRIHPHARHYFISFMLGSYKEHPVCPPMRHQASAQTRHAMSEPSGRTAVARSHLQRWALARSGPS